MMPIMEFTTDICKDREGVGNIAMSSYLVFWSHQDGRTEAIQAIHSRIHIGSYNNHGDKLAQSEVLSLH